ncbi:MAG: ABC transporter ATP-binding protein [Anaerolineales bacterium]|nr:ABC transporter ATP-binding protein [Anaerolineales bacterium]
MSDASNAIETRALTKRFKGFTAVNQVSFYVPTGEIFGLLGPNGAGKTTTIRMLCGIMRPSGGQGSVLGYDIARQPEQIKKRIGYMSQKFSLYNDLTPRENLNFYASVYAVERSQRAARVAELIEMAGLGEHSRQLTRNLSGAWRQRLALACAIVHNPPMLFLDEATAGVDPVSRREFWDLIYRLAGEGVSVLATTHYMDEAEYCNTIGMMFRGEMIAVASPDTLRGQLPGLLVQLDCDNPLKAKEILQALPGVIDSSVHGAQVHASLDLPPDLPAEDECLTEKLELIEQALAQVQVQVSHWEPIQPSLEDVFIHMVDKRRGEPSPESES